MLRIEKAGKYDGNEGGRVVELTCISVPAAGSWHEGTQEWEKQIKSSPRCSAFPKIRRR